MDMMEYRAKKIEYYGKPMRFLKIYLYILLPLFTLAAAVSFGLNIFMFGYQNYFYFLCDLTSLLFAIAALFSLFGVDKLGYHLNIGLWLFLGVTQIARMIYSIVSLKPLGVDPVEFSAALNGIFVQASGGTGDMMNGMDAAMGGMDSAMGMAGAEMTTGSGLIDGGSAIAEAVPQGVDAAITGMDAAVNSAGAASDVASQSLSLPANAMMGILIAIAVVLLIAGILVIIYFVRNRRFFRASLQKLESQAESRKQKDASAKDTVMA